MKMIRMKGNRFGEIMNELKFRAKFLKIRK